MESRFQWVEIRPGLSRLIDTEKLPEETRAAFNITSDYAGYSCPITGNWVEGRAAHRENLKRTGCRVLERGERQDMLRRKQYANEALARHVSETTQRILHERYGDA